MNKSFKSDTNDTNNSKSRWHTEMQDMFSKEFQEVKFSIVQLTGDHQVKTRNRYADVCKDETVIEYQHSRIVREEVNTRNDDYGRRLGKQVVWVIDCTENANLPIKVSESDDLWMLDFEKKWQVEAMQDCKIMFADFGDRIFRIPIASVRQRMVLVYGSWKKDETFVSYLTSEIPIDIPIPFQSTLTVAQDPHGSGKTYRLTRMMIHTELDEYKQYNKYDTFIVITKAHSAKDVVYTEFLVHLQRSGLEFEETKNSGKYIVKFAREDDHKIMCIFGTADSLMFNVSENKMKGTNLFVDLVKTIHQHGPTKLKGPKGRFNYGGEQPRLNGRTLVITDEATTLTESYADALATMMSMCSVDVHLAGDVQQSTLYEDNLLTKVVSEYYANRGDPSQAIPSFPNSKIVVNVGSEVRRFNQYLVDFRNKVMEGFHRNPSHSLNISVPTAAKDVNHSKGEYSIHGIKEVKVSDDSESEEVQESVEEIMMNLRRDVETNNLLPNDIIIVTPFVTHNPLMDELQARIHEFWHQKIKDPKYTQELEKLTGTTYDLESLPWLCVFHRSEVCKPIDTTESQNATRIVSIHASQGDGRKVAYVVGLTEGKLKCFSAGKINIKYESLLNVAISRMKEIIRVFLEPNHDDIWERFTPFIDKELQDQVPPKLYAKRDFGIMNVEIEELNQLNGDLYKDVKDAIMKKIPSKELNNLCPIVDYGHHMVRQAVVHTMFWAKLVVHQIQESAAREQVLTIFRKVGKAQITPLSSKEYFKKIKELENENPIIPVLYYDTGASSFKEVYDRIISILKEVKRDVNLWLKGTHTDMRKFGPAHMIILQYAVELIKYENLHSALATVKMDHVYDVVKCYLQKSDESNQKLEQHYDYLDQVNFHFDSIINHVGEGWQWKIYRAIDLGKRNGGQTQYFKLKLQIYHLIITDTFAIPIVIVPDMSEINIAELCKFVVLYTLMCVQPEHLKPKSDKGIPTWKYVVNKNIQVCFVPLKGAAPVFVDVSDLVKDNMSTIATWLGSYVKQRTKMDIPKAMKIAKHYENNFEVAQDLVAEAHSDKKCPDYMRDAFNDSESSDELGEIMPNILGRHIKTFVRDVRSGR